MNFNQQPNCFRPSPHSDVRRSASIAPVEQQQPLHQQTRPDAGEGRRLQSKRHAGLAAQSG